MDLDPEQAESLFGADRERDIDDVRLSDWITITQKPNGIEIESEDNTYRLNDDETATLLSEMGWDSIWRAISERDKCLRYLRINHA